MAASNTAATDTAASDAAASHAAVAAAAERSAGRGGLWLSAAKLYFTLLGLIQQIALSWLLQVDGYGALRGVLSPASIVYNPLVTAGVQGMSRAVSRVPESERPQAIRLGWLLHSAVAFVVGAGFFLAAPVLGSWLHSEYLVPALRILSGVVIFYGMYAPAVGVLNGMRRFRAQAGFDVVAATLRSVALFGGGWLLLSQGTTRAVEGACWGFLGVGLVMVLVSLLVVGVGKSGPTRLRVVDHLGFILPVILAQVVLNLLLQADTNTLRGFATRAAVKANLGAEAADQLIGAYNAGQLFGFLPYQLLIGITFILFPMLATAHAQGDRAAVARYVREGTRIATLFVGLLLSVSAGISKSLLLLVFPPKFAELGTDSMQVLTIGLGAFALFGVFTTVLNSLGKQWQGLVVTGLALGAVSILNLVWLRGEPFGAELLLRTAWSTSIAMFIAMLISGVLVQRVAGAVIDPKVLLKVVLIVVILILVGRQLPALSRVVTVLVSSVLGGAYLLLLWATRVVGPQDLQRLRNIVGARK